MCLKISALYEVNADDTRDPPHQASMLPGFIPLRTSWRPGSLARGIPGVRGDTLTGGDSTSIQWRECFVITANRCSDYWTTTEKNIRQQAQECLHAVLQLSFSLCLLKSCLSKTTSKNRRRTSVDNKGLMTPTQGGGRCDDIFQNNL